MSQATTDATGPADAAGGKFNELAELLGPVALRLGRRLRNEPQRGGASAVDMLLLQRLQIFPGIGVTALAERERVTLAAMSAQVKRLEAAGWIAREAPAADTDRRRVCLNLTPAGEAEVERVRALRNSWLTIRLARLDEAERVAIARAIRPLSRILSMTVDQPD